MAILEEKLAAQLLENLEGKTDREKWENCSRQFPWYPTPWLMLAETAEGKQKAATWFRNEHRIHWLLNNKNAIDDSWIKVQLESLQAEEAGDTSAYRDSIKGQDNNEISVREDLEQVEILQKETAQHFTEQIDSQEDNTAISPAVIEDEAVIDLYREAPIEQTKPAVESIEAANPTTAAQKQQYLETTGDQQDNDLTTPEIFSAKVVEEAIPVTLHQAAPEELKPVEITGGNDEVDSKEKPVQTNTEPPLKINLGPIPTGNKPEAMIFEPLYAVDYFASLGIKVDLSSLPKTKFDVQVKSFTQWLKTMKKVPAADPNLPSDPLVDAQASASVLEKEVVTEAMAEVLEMQGKHKKAIEILEKLILLHPEKSTFFAARIEILKEKQ